MCAALRKHYTNVVDTIVLLFTDLKGLKRSRESRGSETQRIIKENGHHRSKEENEYSE